MKSYNQCWESYTEELTVHIHSHIKPTMAQSMYELQGLAGATIISDPSEDLEMFMKC